MACTIVATAGSASATSYATIAQGDTYHETHLYADDWVDAGDDEKCKALQMATRMLDQQYEWIGSVSSSDQALLWPRSGVVGPNGYLEANDEIPIRIVQATAELARQLIAGDRTVDSDIETQGIKSVNAGDVAVEFSGAGVAKPIPDSVNAMVSCYGVKTGGSGGTVTLRRA